MEAPPPPPEASLLYRARESAEITIADAAKAAKITDTRWSQIERGHERRKGIDVPARAKAGTLARMARVVGIPPDRLESEGRRPDAAEILREILRSPRREPPPLRPADPYPAEDKVAEEILTDLLSRYEGREEHEVVRAMAGQHGKDAGTRAKEILRFAKDPELDRDVLARLMSLRLDDDSLRVVQALGSRRGQRDQVRIGDILDFLGFVPPEMGEAGNGTAG